MPEDMAMLKIVNRNANTFYLESATYQPHQTDIDRNEANGKTQESMYLVVRSLKVNNEKIVSIPQDHFNNKKFQELFNSINSPPSFLYLELHQHDN